MVLSFVSFDVAWMYSRIPLVWSSSVTIEDLYFNTSKPALVNCSPVSLISLLSLTQHVPPSDRKKKDIREK